MIELENVTKIYQMGKLEVAALNGVTLSIGEGEMVAIMGRSGSGKSTMMNLIGCLDVPTSGRYILEGEDVGQLSDDRLAAVRNRKVGFVFQTYNLLARSTALANVELPLLYGNGKDRRRRSLEALDRVGLADRAGHRPPELSGGEQQRVGIARALVKQPSILLADEPTGNVDDHMALRLMHLFEELNKLGTTIVIATHNEHLVNRLGHVCLRLDKGWLEVARRLGDMSPGNAA